MRLEKAVLLNTVTRAVLRVQFNPEEYSLDAGNSFAEFPVVGLPSPPLQYVRGTGRSLRVELFFDTTDDQSDVSVQTSRITGLLDKDPQLHAPPPLLFSWGGFDFACVLEKVGQRYTHFRPDGTPLRAYLTASFREYVTATVQTEVGLFVLPPTVVNLVGGETLSQVAGQTVGDPGAWRTLADLNNIDNPRKLDGRQSLNAPSAART